MARRSITPRKGVVSPEQLPDHSDLSLLYPDARPVNENPISTQAERDEKARNARGGSIRSLRKWGPAIGFYVTVPYVVGTVVIQQVIAGIPNIAPGDIGGAMFVVFMSFFTALGTIAVTYLLFRKAASYFYARALRMWPVAATVLACVALGAPLLFELGAAIAPTVLSYLIALALILITGALTAAIAVFVWTTKWPVYAKLIGMGVIALATLAALLVL